MRNSSSHETATGVPVDRTARFRRWFQPLAIAVVAITCSVLPSGSSLLLHAAGMAAQETDTDGDTMPDAWEDFFGLDPDDAADATGDPDNDGRTNAQEFAARRHPLGLHVRYFAEGSTGYFDTSVAVLNLSATDTAHVALALLSESGNVISHRFTLGPRQRQSVPLNTVLASGAVAIIVESDVPVAADRFMTWGTSGIGASLDSGASAPATTWYIAEGATGPFFLYYLLQNPATTPATVTVRYLVEGAAPVSRTRTLPPQSRTTIFVNEDDPALARASLGAVVTSDVPIFVERAMYLDAGGTLGGGAASAASPQLSTQWYFGEGATGPFFQAFLAMLNPGTTAATATVTYHLADGSTVSKPYTVPAEGRRTVWFNGEAESDPALAALANGPVWFTVSSTQPILGERAMWWSTWPWYEGHAAPGSTTTGVSWAVPEGRTGGPASEQTYVLIGNTTSTAGQIRVTLIPDTGAASTRDLPIPAGQRLTVNVGTLFGLTDARFSVIVDSLGAPGVPLAVDYARYRSVNGLSFSGGGAAPAVLVDAAPTVSSTTPAANATGVAVDANLTVTFSEPVTVGAGAFVLECPASTPIALTNLTSSPATTFTLAPVADRPVSTACTLRVVASQVTDVDTADPPHAMAADVVVPFTTATCATITVSLATLPGGTNGVAYAPVTLTQTGGAAPITWSLTAGALPGGLSLSTAGVLGGTPTASGPFTFTVGATDANGCTGSAPRTLSILSAPNQAPSFTAGANQTALEDGGPQAVADWATAISPGPVAESSQVVTFNVTGNTNPALFSIAPAISPAGTLTYTSAPNATGVSTITVLLQDNGGTADGGVDTSAAQTFTITVTGVNDAPSFTAGPNESVAEDSGVRTVSIWATAISAGPADEAGQTLTFNVTNNTNAALFSAGPAVDSSGTLTYTPAVDAVGTATITLTLQDSGSTANGGVDTSAAQTFTITITGVNDAPGFTVGADQTVAEDAGAQTVAVWATGIGAGSADETVQTLTFNVTNNTNAALFSVGPTVDSNGALTYTPAANAVGTATITLTLQDSGGTTGGGADTSASQTFTITVTDVNDAPSFTAGGNPSSAEDAGPQTVTSWATAISRGPADEAAQTPTFVVTNNTMPALFSAAPAVSSAGVLTYTSAPNAFGSADITLVLQDDGGTANGGVNTSAPQTIKITVTPVNEAPTLTNATIAYSTVGNTQLHVQGATRPGLVSVSDASGALLKSAPTDVDGPGVPVVVAQTNADTGEGTLTINPDGSFTYVPDAGFSGIDTFIVQVTDTVTLVNLTVQITVGELVWYVNNETGPNNPPGSDGRSTDAFETLAEAQAASGLNSTIFVFNGLTPATPLSDSIALKNGQKLIGEGVGLTVAGFPTLVPAGTRPRIVASGDAVTVVANTLNGDRTGVEIRGLNLTSTAGNAVAASSADTQNLGVRISENTVTSAALDGIFIVPGAVSPGTTTLAVHDNTISNTAAAIRVEGGSDVINAGATFNVSNNIMRASLGAALAVKKLGGSGSWSGTIANNTVGVTGVSGSGSATGSGIFVLAGGTGTYTASITGNQVRQYDAHGIFAQADGAGVAGNAAMNLTVTGNTVTEPAAGGGPATNGFHLFGGTTPGDNSQVCVALSGNTLAGSGESGTDFRLRQFGSSTVRLPGYAGSATDAAAVVAFIQAQNTGAGTGGANVQSPPGGGFVGGAACATP